MKNWKTNLTALIILGFVAYSIIFNKDSWSDVKEILFPILTAVGLFAAKDHNTPQ